MDRRSKSILAAYIILAYSSTSVLPQDCNLNMAGLGVFAAMVALTSVIAAVHK